jgi:site-specific DNA recombinase
MRIALYVRVSTHHQAETQTSEQQVERLQSYLTQQGWKLPPENLFRDEGYSGATLKRPGLDRLRDRVAEANLDRILMTAPDRLARNYVHQVLLLEELQRFGCEVIFLDRPMSQDPHDQLLLQIRGAVAEYERTLIAERMRRGRQRKLQAGLLVPWTRPPYGYRLDPERPRDPHGIRLEEREAAVVQQIFTRYVESSISLYRLAQTLETEGIPAPQGQAHWSPTSLRGILRNPAYTGHLYAGRYHFGAPRRRGAPLRPVGKRAQTYQERPRTDWIEVGTIPAIVSLEVFAQVEEKLARNQQLSQRNANAERYLLRALVSCGLCRHCCSGRTCPQGGYAYYECTGRRAVAGRETCGACLIPVKDLDTLVWEDLCSVLLRPEQLRNALERALGGGWLPQELQARGKQLQSVSKSIEQQQERWTEAYLAGVLSLDEYGRRRQQLEQRRQTAQQQEQQLRAQAQSQEQLTALAGSLEEFCRRVQAGLQAATFAHKRELVLLLIDRVIVTGEEVEIRYVLPTSPASEQTRFCQLRLDYFQHQLAKMGHRDLLVTAQYRD